MRNFIEDLMYVIGNSDIDGKKDLQFPITYSKEFAETNVREIDLSERSKNSLCRANITNMKGIIDNMERIAKIRNCGTKSAKEIKSSFMQKWYETLDENQAAAFWEEFIIINA